MNDDPEPEELKRCYSVGSFGPFPITFYSLDGQVFYAPLEHDDRGPFESLEEAMIDAEKDFGMTAGGFHETLEDAEEHAESMEKDGYRFE